MDLTDPQQFDRLKGRPDPTRLTALTLAPGSDIARCRAAELSIRAQDYARALELLRGQDSLLARGLRVKTLAMLRKWDLVRDATRVIPTAHANTTPPNDIEGIIHHHEARALNHYWHENMSGALLHYKHAEVLAETIHLEDRLQVIRGNIASVMTALGLPASPPAIYSADGEVRMHQALTETENALLAGDATSALEAAARQPDDGVVRVVRATMHLWNGDAWRAAHALSGRPPHKPDWAAWHGVCSLMVFACLPDTTLVRPMSALQQIHDALRDERIPPIETIEYATRVWPLGVVVGAGHPLLWPTLRGAALGVPFLANRFPRDGIWIREVKLMTVHKGIRADIMNHHNGHPPRDPKRLNVPRQRLSEFLRGLEEHNVEYRRIITDKAVLSAWGALHEQYPTESWDVAMEALESRLERIG